MAECINCCAPMQSDKVDFKMTISRSARAPTIVALNYIFKVSGKCLEENSGDDGAGGDLGLCHPCWTVVLKLFLLHKELAALTKLESLVNRTFRMIDSENKNASNNKSQLGSNTNVISTSKPVVSKDLTPPKKTVVFVGIKKGTTACPSVPKEMIPVKALSPVKKIVIFSNQSQSHQRIGTTSTPAVNTISDKTTSNCKTPLPNTKSVTYFETTAVAPVAALRQQVSKVESDISFSDDFKDSPVSPVAVSTAGAAVNPKVLCEVTPPPPQPLAGTKALESASSTAVKVHPQIPILGQDEPSKVTPGSSIISSKNEVKRSVPLCASELFKIQKRLLASKKLNPPTTGDGGLSSLKASNFSCQNILGTGSSAVKENPATASTSSGDLSSGNRRKQQISLRPEKFDARLNQHIGATYRDDEPNILQSPSVSIVDIYMSGAPFPKPKPKYKPKSITNPNPVRPKRKRKSAKTHVKKIEAKKPPHVREKPKPVTCEQCGQVYKQLISLNLHMAIAHQRKYRIKCYICERPMLNHYGLRTHLETHRNPKERAQERARRAQEREGQSFLCQECGKTYASWCNLKKHEYTHREVRKVYSCTELNCNYSALTLKSLLNHKNCMHTDSTYFKYKCNRCSEKFRQGSVFRHHQGFCCDPLERPHLCANCGKRFKLKQHLELHYSVLHKMGPEAARALVYPGLPLQPSSSNLRKGKRSHSKKAPKPEDETKTPMDSAMLMDGDTGNVYLQL